MEMAYSSMCIREIKFNAVGNSSVFVKISTHENIPLYGNYIILHTGSYMHIVCMPIAYSTKGTVGKWKSRTRQKQIQIMEKLTRIFAAL